MNKPIRTLAILLVLLLVGSLAVSCKKPPEDKEEAATDTGAPAGDVTPEADGGSDNAGDTEDDVTPEADGGSDVTADDTEPEQDEPQTETPVFPLDQVLFIIEISEDRFLARPAAFAPYSYEITIYGTLSDDWCAGDCFTGTFRNVKTEDEFRIEAELVSIEAASYTPPEVLGGKPVVYLYPERETDITVRLDLDGRLTCAYPAYNGAWKVIASPDGTLTDAGGKTYNYLFWEGTLRTEFDYSEGFCVRGADTAAFLEKALAALGLNRREANEFIVYWLPRMQDNKYNVISFQTDAYTDAAKLDISPAPDTVIRVFMAWYPSDTRVEIKEQTLKAPERKGFVAVEWGAELR